MRLYNERESVIRLLNYHLVVRACGQIVDLELYSKMDKVDKIPIYLYKECVSDLVNAVDFSERLNCNVLVTSIANPRFRREFQREPLRQNHIRFTRSELLLDPAKWQSQVVAKLSDCIDCDSIDDNVRKFSEQTIKQEIQFSQHVSGQGQHLIKIRGTNTSNLARTISAELTCNYSNLNSNPTTF